MMALVSTLVALASALLFPAWFTAVLAIVAAVATPIAPFAVGSFMDLLYLNHGASVFPFYSLIGLCASIVAFSVRHFVKTSIMR